MRSLEVYESTKKAQFKLVLHLDFSLKSTTNLEYVKFLKFAIVKIKMSVAL